MTTTMPTPGSATAPTPAGPTRCEGCICDPALCATDDTGRHCETRSCGACLHGCPDPDPRGCRYCRELPLVHPLARCEYCRQPVAGPLADCTRPACAEKSIALEAAWKRLEDL